MKKTAAYIVVLFVIVGIYLSIWAGGKAEEICGPTQIARYNNGEIWIVHHNELNILDEDGRFKRAINQRDLGISIAFADMAVTKDWEVIIGDVESREIRWYSNDGSLIRVIKVADGEKGTYQGTFKFAFDEEGHRLFVTDSSNHKVKIFDNSGKYLSSFGQKGDRPGDLHFPNRILISQDGLLYVADTNNHRISVLDKEGKPIDNIKTLNKEIPKRNHALSNYEKMALGGSIWPTFFDILTSDGIVAINKGDGLRYGDVVITGKKGGIKKLPLPPDSDPINVLARQHDILVTDNENMRVLRYSLDGEYLDDFGDSTFKEKLERSKALRDGFRKAKNGSQTGLLLLLPCLLIALLMERRKAQIRTADSEKGLAERLDLIPVSSVDILSKKKTIYIVAWVFFLIIYPALLITFVFMRPDLVDIFLLLALLYFIMLTVAYAGSKLSKSGIFRAWQRKNIEKKLKIQSTALLSILRHDEKIRFFTCSIGTRKTKIPHLFILTTHRILILKTDLSGRQIKRVRELSYQSIDKVDTQPWTKLETRIARLNGTGFISIHLQEIEEVLQFRLLWAELADIIRDEIAERKSLSKDSFSGIRDICIKCSSTIPTGGNQCLKCGLKKVSPVQAALLSLLYPGLGQLKYGSLLRGTIFMIIGTAFLFSLVIFLYTLYRGNAEIYPYDLTQIVLYSAIFWALSVTDAYYSAKQ